MGLPGRDTDFKGLCIRHSVAFVFSLGDHLHENGAEITSQLLFTVVDIRF